VDIVDSTPRAVELGDAPWRERLARHDELAATEVARFGGTISDFAGDGLLATFDGPARAPFAARLRSGTACERSASTYVPVSTRAGWNDAVEAAEVG
jgi:class 3 adenylate cyclase